MLEKGLKIIAFAAILALALHYIPILLGETLPEFFQAIQKASIGGF